MRKPTEVFTLKHDVYRKSRGGYSRFLVISCSHCDEALLLYQKDGPGHLKRLYVDRIHAPKIDGTKNLVCKKCKRLIAIPGIYEKENRPVFFLLSYAFTKKVSTGIFRE